MWISKIELVCFKSYRHETFTFPEPTDNKNVVLIGGLNGYGKTSILEALYLCLYGKDSMSYFARAGLKTDDSKGYPTFLERAFNGEARRDGRDTMMVKVIINKSKSIAVDITRKWYFRSNGAWTAEEEATVRTIKRGIPEAPKSDGKNNFHLSDMLDDFFVPAHIAPFFFFDGEEVKKLADQNRVEQVKQGLEGLLGVVLLRSLSDRLRSFEASKRSEVVAVDEKKISELHASLIENEETLNLAKSELEKILEMQKSLRNSRQSLLNRITSAGGGGGDIATVKDLVEEREQLRNKMRDCEKQLEEILAGRLPFHLVPKELLDVYKKQLESEINFFTWEADKNSLEPRKNEFETSFINLEEPAFVPPLTANQLSTIKLRIDTAWSRLFYPPPNDCAKEIIHFYLYEPLRTQTIDFFNTMSLSRNEIDSLISERHTLTGRIDDLGRRISKLEGIDRDGTLASLKKDLDKAQNELDKISDQIPPIQRKIDSLGSIVSAQRAEYEREQKKLDDSSPVRAILEKSERVRSVIDSVIPDVFPLKVKALANAMTDVYKKLAHKNQVDNIEINDNGTTKVLGKTGKEITFDRSAGENQIFATALIAGLAKVSGVMAPMVVDTPLGRLDSKHRANILKFWTSDRNRQIILLSQDEEIDNKYYTLIEKHVGKTYILEHVEVGDDIGRTTAKEDVYFERDYQ